MAVRQVTFPIDCGDTTCASKPGKFCRFYGSRNFGQVPVCTLFPAERGWFTDLPEKDGWVQRCPACLEAEKEG